jgi:hypothetical protein
MWNTTLRGNVFTTRGPQSLVGNPVPRDESELQPSTRIFMEMRERETTAQHVRRTHRGREDLEGRLASGGWQLEALWGEGTSL